MCWSKYFSLLLLTTMFLYITDILSIPLIILITIIVLTGSFECIKESGYKLKIDKCSSRM